MTANRKQCKKRGLKVWFQAKGGTVCINDIPNIHSLNKDHPETSTNYSEHSGMTRNILEQAMLKAYVSLTFALSYGLFLSTISSTSLRQLIAVQTLTTTTQYGMVTCWTMLVQQSMLLADSWAPVLTLDHRTASNKTEQELGCTRVGVHHLVVAFQECIQKRTEGRQYKAKHKMMTIEE